LPIVFDPYQKQSIISIIELLKRKEVDFLELMKKCQNSNYPYSLRNQLTTELEYRTEYLHYLKDLFNKCVISSIVIISNEIVSNSNKDSILGMYVMHAKAGTLNHVTLEPYHQQQIENYINSQNEMHQLKMNDVDSSKNNDNKNNDTNVNDANIDSYSDSDKMIEIQTYTTNKLKSDSKLEDSNIPIIRTFKIYKDEFTFIIERVVNLLSMNNLQIHRDIILNRINIIKQFYLLVLKTGCLVNSNIDEPNINIFFDNVISVWEYLVNDVKSYIINQEGIFSMKDLLDSSSKYIQ